MFTNATVPIRPTNMDKPVTSTTVTPVAHRIIRSKYFRSAIAFLYLNSARSAGGPVAARQVNRVSIIDSACVISSTYRRHLRRLFRQMGRRHGRYQSLSFLLAGRILWFGFKHLLEPDDIETDNTEQRRDDPSLVSNVRMTTNANWFCEIFSRSRRFASSPGDRVHRACDVLLHA